MKETPIECAFCKREAKIVYKEFKNGIIEIRRVCIYCSILRGKMSSFDEEKIKQIHLGQEKMNEKQIEKCQRCCSCWKNMDGKELLGCSLCYSSFENFLFQEILKMNSLISTLFSASSEKPLLFHLGKTPRALEDKEKMQKFDLLQASLNKAIVKENYELAAQIRDDINKLNQQKNSKK